MCRKQLTCLLKAEAAAPEFPAGGGGGRSGPGKGRLSRCASAVGSVENRERAMYVLSTCEGTCAAPRASTWELVAGSEVDCALARQAPPPPLALDWPLAGERGPRAASGGGAPGPGPAGGRGENVTVSGFQSSASACVTADSDGDCRLLLRRP